MPGSDRTSDQSHKTHNCFKFEWKTNELKDTEVDADSTQTENSCCHAVKGNDAERYTFIC